MTLDEAIAHARDVASDQRMRSGVCTQNDTECDKFSACLQCAEEHEQLAEWLEELNGLRELKDTITGNSESLVRKGYNNAVDDFENKIKECIYEKGLYFDRYLVEEIAEKLRGCDEE